MMLDTTRTRGDGPADSLVDALAARGAIASTNALLRGVVANADPLPAALSADVRDFFARDAQLPAWADRARIHRAQAFAERNAAGIACALFCASLPLAFAGARGAHVLRATGRMEHDLDRRIHETGRFVFDVVMPGGFEPRGNGLRAIGKVRLVHAVVRRALRGGDEIAINQEDMLGTLMTFSVIVVRSLERLGVEVSRRDGDDYYHLWRAAGVALGVEPALIPERLADARELADAIAARQLAPSVDGRVLAGGLVRGIARHVPLSPALPRALMNHLLGERVLAMLGVDGCPFAARPGRALRAVEPFARALLEAALQIKLGSAPAFAMPCDLGRAT